MNSSQASKHGNGKAHSERRVVLGRFHTIVQLLPVVGLALTLGVHLSAAKAGIVVFREIPYSPLGDASLALVGTPETGMLVVSGIGSSGQDGASADLVDACFHSAQWEPLPPPEDGDLLRFRVRGRLGELTDQLLGTVFFEDTGPDLELAVELLSDVMFPNQIWVDDGSSLLYSGEIADLGVAATVGEWPSEMSIESGCYDVISSALRFTWNTPTSVSIPGGPTVNATAISIISGAFSWSFSRLEMYGANISPVTVLDADFANRGTAVPSSIASWLVLSPNVPNPFNPRTEIYYSLSRAAPVLLTVHNIRGQLVKTLIQRHQAAGPYSVTWDGSDQAGQDVGSGTYIVSLRSGAETRSRKVILVR